MDKKKKMTVFRSNIIYLFIIKNKNYEIFKIILKDFLMQREKGKQWEC